MIFSFFMARSIEGIVMESSNILQVFVLIVPLILSGGNCSIIIELSGIERAVVEDVDSISVCFSVGEISEEKAAVWLVHFTQTMGNLDIMVEFSFVDLRSVFLTMDNGNVFE